MDNNIEVGSKTREGKKKEKIAKKAAKDKQSKFFVDLSNDNKSLSMVVDLMSKCNEKDYGSVISFKDLCLFGINKVTDKDIEKLQELSLSEMEKVERALIDHNKKAGSNLSMGEFLIKKLGIN